jgi:hypothetical protein
MSTFFAGLDVLPLSTRQPPILKATTSGALRPPHMADNNSDEQNNHFITHHFMHIGFPGLIVPVPLMAFIIALCCCCIFFVCIPTLTASVAFVIFVLHFLPQLAVLLNIDQQNEELANGEILNSELQKVE